jgi:hypothetical protein
VSNILFLLAVLLVSSGIVSVIRRRRRGIVAERGMGVGADLGTLRDKPRVRVRSVTMAGPGRADLVLTPEPDPVDPPGFTPASDLVFVVSLQEEEFGFEQLEEWRRSSTVLAIVVPANSHLIRLRSIEELQPLTLRRVDQQ